VHYKLLLTHYTLKRWTWITYFLYGFRYYLWDLFYWSKAGSYNVDPSFKKNFSVEANKIYYLGNYTSKGFYLIKNYKEIIIKQFSNFVDLEIVSPYI